MKAKNKVFQSLGEKLFDQFLNDKVVIYHTYQKILDTKIAKKFKDHYAMYLACSDVEKGLSSITNGSSSGLNVFDYGLFFEDRINNIDKLRSPVYTKINNLGYKSYKWLKKFFLTYLVSDYNEYLTNKKAEEDEERKKKEAEEAEKRKNQNNNGGLMIKGDPDGDVGFGISHRVDMFPRMVEQIHQIQKDVNDLKQEQAKSTKTSKKGSLKGKTSNTK